MLFARYTIKRVTAELSKIDEAKVQSALPKTVQYLSYSYTYVSRTEDLLHGRARIIRLAKFNPVVVYTLSISIG